MMPAMAQDSTGYDRKVQRQIFIERKIEQSRNKKQLRAKVIKYGLIAAGSFYVGYLAGQNDRKRHFRRGRFGDRDYGGKP